MYVGGLAVDGDVWYRLHTRTDGNDVRENNEGSYLPPSSTEIPLFLRFVLFSSEMARKQENKIRSVSCPWEIITFILETGSNIIDNVQARDRTEK